MSSHLQSLAPASLSHADLDSSIPRLFSRQLATPHQLALVGSQDSWSYHHLDEISSRIAATLLNHLGDKPGPVALLLPHDATMIAAILACLKSGKIYVALDIEHPSERLQSLLKASGAQLLLTDAAHQSYAQELIPANTPILIADDSSHPDSPTQLPELTGSTLACISYTSGSTGQPKGIVLDHASLIRRALCFHHNANPGPDDRVGLIAHCGLGAAIPPLFGSLLCGATLFPFCLSTTGIPRLADWLRQERITLIQTVPTVLRRLADLLEDQPPLISLRWIRMAGELLLPADVARFSRCFGPQCRFELAYATTETGTITQMELKPDPALTHPLPVGFPAIQTQVVILNESGIEVPRGQIGQIIVRGRHLNRGQWPSLNADPGLTTHITGDIGRIRSDGALEWHGRNDDQVKIRGQRIELGEIEAALRNLENVRDVAAAVWEPTPGEQRLVAYVVAQKPRYANPRLWRRQLRHTLPSALLPQTLVVLPELPIGTGGKLDRAALPRPSPLAARTADEILPGRDHLEKTLIEIWEAVLGIVPIGRADDFLSLGGDSLSAVAIVARVEEEFGRLPPLTLFLQAATVEDQARALSEQWSALRSTRVPIQSNGKGPPLYFVHGAEGEVFHFWALSRRLGDDRPLWVLQSPGVLGEWPMRTLKQLAVRHATDILAHDSHTPCNLMGHCAGGLLALEIARYLIAHGKPVDQVILLDAFLPNQTPGTRPSRWYKRMADTQAHFWRSIRWRLLLMYDRLWGRGGRRFGATYRRFVEHAFRNALRQYRSQTYPGRVLALLAEGPELTEQIDPRFRLLRDYLPQAQIQRIPGSHIECLRMPHVDALAATLRQVLTANYD